MAAGKFFAKAYSVLSSPYFSIPYYRRLSTRAVPAAGNLDPLPGQSVLHFLRDRGLDKEAMAGFSPQLLQSKVSKDLTAQFDLFRTIGLSVPEAANALQTVDLLSVSLYCLQRRIGALRTIVSDDGDLVRVIKKSLWALGCPVKISRMVENIAKVREWGVSDAKIKTLIVTHPRFLQLKPQYIDDAADKAETEFRIPRNSKMFIYAVNTLCRLKESTRESKFRLFENLGWERSDVIALFKAFPHCFTLADANLVKKVGFLMNEIGISPSYITKHSVMMGLSMEKRLRPRFELLTALKSKNLLPEKGHGFYRVCSFGEKEFRERYVTKFMNEEPAACQAYIECLESPKR